MIKNTLSPNVAPRTRQLDSLRGIAAVCVMLHHFAWMRLDTPTHQPKLTPYFWHAYEVLHPLFLGHEAVLLFFTLSGFVLTLSLRKRSSLVYSGYILHRIARIYLPYLGALVLAILGNALVHGRVPHWSRWGERNWIEPPHLRDILTHAPLIGVYAQQFNQVFWSLIVEMRVSFLIPAIVYFLSRMSARAAVIAVSVLTIGDAFFTPYVAAHAGHVVVDLEWSMHFAVFFGYGSLLALHASSVEKWFTSLRLLQRIGLLLASFFLIGYGWTFGQHLHRFHIDQDFMAAGASVGLIICSLYSQRVTAVLLHPALLWLGKVSYSLYLLHLTVILFVSSLMGIGRPFLETAALSLLASLALAANFWRFVEEPARLLGRYLDTKSKPAPFNNASPIAASLIPR